MFKIIHVYLAKKSNMCVYMNTLFSHGHIAMVKTQNQPYIHVHVRYTCIMYYSVSTWPLLKENGSRNWKKKENPTKLYSFFLLFCFKKTYTKINHVTKELWTQINMILTDILRTRQYQIRLNKYDRAPELVKCRI